MKHKQTRTYSKMPLSSGTATLSLFAQTVFNLPDYHTQHTHSTHTLCKSWIAWLGLYFFPYGISASFYVHLVGRCSFFPTDTRCTVLKPYYTRLKSHSAARMIIYFSSFPAMLFTPVALASHALICLSNPCETDIINLLVLKDRAWS